jgi:hypothetical protein
MHGHLMTVVPHLRGGAPLPADERVEVLLRDPVAHDVRVHGLHRRPSGARTLAVIVHGLAGTPEASYCATAARAAEAAGCASLRIGLRGADRSGDDIGHGGLTEDIHALLAAPALAGYSRIVLIGYSIGGHLALRAATEAALDARVQAVAAICAPLDLGRAADDFDAPARRPYRHAVFRALDEIYEAVARRRHVPVSPAAVRRAPTCRERDRLTVVPRFGFRDPDEYYATASVRSRLRSLRVPALLVLAEADPIIAARSVLHALEDAPSSLEMRLLPVGGHVFFPADVSLGEAAPPGLAAQVVAWLLRKVRGEGSWMIRYDE